MNNPIMRCKINLKDYHKRTLLNDGRHLFRILIKDLFKHKQNVMAMTTIHKLTSEKGRIVLAYEDYIYTLQRKTNVIRCQNRDCRGKIVICN